MPFSVGQRRVRGSHPGDQGARSAGVSMRSIPCDSCVPVRRTAHEGGARAEERVPAFLNLGHLLDPQDARTHRVAVILVKTIRELVDSRSNLIESDGLLAPVALDHGESHAEPCSIVCDEGGERERPFAAKFLNVLDTTLRICDVCETRGSASDGIRTVADSARPISHSLTSSLPRARSGAWLCAASRRTPARRESWTRSFLMTSSA